MSCTRTGDTKSRMRISSNYALRLIGDDSPVWDDIRVPVTTVKTGGVNDPNFIQFKDDVGGTSQGVYTYAFDAATEEELFFAVQIPHNWKKGSDIELHCHWAKSNSNAGNVYWACEYTMSEIASVFGDTVEIGSATVTAGAMATDEHNLTELDSIDMSAVDSVSTMLICRFFRKAADVLDTYDSDAYLFEIDFHYQIDSLGPETEYIKL